MGAIVVSVFVTLVAVGSVIYFHYQDKKRIRQTKDYNK